MSATISPSGSARAVEAGDVPALSLAQIDASCRLPLLVLFSSAAVWLIIGSAFALVSSLKFHSPNFLADCAWLTYGRVRPAYNNALLYGFCVPAGLGVGLWLLARLGRARLAQSWLVTLGAKLWNLGVTAGLLGILAGDGTGFENLDMPRYAALMLFLGCVLIGVWGVITFHQRRERQLFVSQWFLVTALFWFPWIYSTATLLLLAFPVRGVAQAVIAWWYSNNLEFVWLGLVGLAAIFYFVPKLTHRPLSSHYLALFTFGMLILFGSWGGIPNTAPVPAWMPAISTVATVLTFIPILTFALNLHGTLDGRWSLLLASPTLRFIGFGVVSFLIAGLMNVVGALNPVGQVVSFTWFTPAQTLLTVYGFFAMTMFGAIYYILPQLTGLAFPSARLVRGHFLLAAAGVALIVLPLAVGGLVQGFKLRDPNVAFLDITKSTLMFLRVSTLGEILLLVGHVIFVANLVGLANRFYRSRALSAYAGATADFFETAEVKP